MRGGGGLSRPSDARGFRRIDGQDSLIEVPVLGWGDERDDRGEGVNRQTAVMGTRGDGKPA